MGKRRLNHSLLRPASKNVKDPSGEIPPTNLFAGIRKQSNPNVKMSNYTGIATKLKICSRNNKNKSKNSEF